MLIWAVVNVVLSLLALAFALVNKSAPHRLRFHVCFIALLCWLVPWAQAPHWLPNLLSLDLWGVEKRFIAQTATATNLPLIIIDTRNVPLANDETLLHVPLLMLTALSLIGLALFAWNLKRHQQRLQALKRSASDATHYWRDYGIASSVPILLQNRIGGAFSSGVFRPVIWVHEELTASEELPTLLRHELTHIEQHDNWYLLAITLVEKLLFWNPLVWCVGRQARELQELSCDERCRATNTDYPAALAALMLSNLGVSRSTAQEPLLLSANIFNKTNLDIQRLKVLQRSHQMKPRHIVCAVATAVLAVTTIGLVTAQPEPDQNTLEQHIAMVVKNPRVSMQTMVNSNGMGAITFSLHDAPLTVALVPLANMLNGIDQSRQMPVTDDSGAQVNKVFALRRMGPDEAGSTEAQIITGEPTPEQKAALDMVNAELQKAAMDKLKVEVDKLKAELPAGAQTKMVWFEGSQESNKVVLEDASAKTRHVTVSGDNLTVQEAIAKIADASGCNIFKDKDTIVVDYCKPQ